MRKKGLLVLVLAIFAAASAFAAPEFKLSAGAGGYFTSDFGGGGEGSQGDYSKSIKTPYFGGGGFAFFDATFVELSLGIWGGGGTYEEESDLPLAIYSAEFDTSVMGLDIGLLGKYPVAVNDKLTLFPLLGITYRIVLSAEIDGNQYKNSDGDDASGDFSALWFKFGGGLDYSFTDAIYLRGDVLYGLRLANKFENDRVDSDKESYPDADVKTLLGHGLEIKLAIGYRF
jgi:opacity protein-like surface antigen